MFSRRCWSALLTVALLGTSVGYPAPARTGKDCGQPFPCIDKPCGCQNAEQCWRHCCCTTLEQRLQWARENGVTPPADIVAEAEKVTAKKAVAKTGHCCCCCKQRQANADAPEVSTSDSNSGGRTVNWVCGLSVQKCRSLQLMALTCGTGLPPREAVQVTLGDRCEPWSASVILNWPTISFRPPVPPPRTAAA